MSQPGVPARRGWVNPEMTTQALTFTASRPQLFAVAYRMLGSVSDAEDVLQDAYLRWVSAVRDDIDNPAAYLTTIVTRICLDVLKSARVKREVYVGPWLPEPLLCDTMPDPADAALVADSLSMAFLVLLESLSPLERAAFLLREVFGYEYDEIAAVLERDAAACRQLVSRARKQVDARRPRYAASGADTGEAAVMGKNLGDDLREGKTTLPLIAAMQRGTANQSALIKEAIETGGVAMLDQVIDIVKSTGALDVARLAATQEAQRAIAAARQLPAGPHSDCLLQLATQLLERQS